MHVGGVARDGPRPTPTPSPPATLIAAGDIASCDSTGDEATAALVDARPGTVATLGDNAYVSGTPGEFGACYGPSWGRFRDRSRPALGNHDYGTPGAAGYFAYFGEAAGPPGGYYSYQLGQWHVIVLNSNCWAVGGCHAGSPQDLWLKAQLAASNARCSLAYWHHPRFSSGLHGPSIWMDEAWAVLAGAGADLALAGHDHHYERFAPQDAAGAYSQAGMRQFVVGTGGSVLYAVGPPAANSEVALNDAFGVLVLTLRPDGYDWEFVDTGGLVRDAGSGSCH